MKKKYYLKMKLQKKQESAGSNKKNQNPYNKSLYVKVTSE